MDKPSTTPFPATGERFLLFLLPEELQDEIVGDLNELFVSDVINEGAAKAVRNFWFEFLRMLPFLLRKFSHKLLRKRYTMSLFLPHIAPRRRVRLIGGTLLVAFIIALNLVLARLILFVYDFNTQTSSAFHNQASAGMVAFYLSCSEAPILAPEMIGHFADFLADSTMHELNPVAPTLPYPFSQFNHFVYGYHYHDKTVVHSPTLATDRLPLSLVDKQLAKGLRQRPQTGKTTILDYHESKTKTKAELDSIVMAEREAHEEEMNRIITITSFQQDSLWTLRLCLAESGDTMYFRGVATDRQFVKANHALIYDAAIENSPAIKMQLRKKNSRKPLDAYEENQLVVVVHEGGKVVYQRGDTTNCKRIYPPDIRKYGKDETVVELFIGHRFDPANFRKEIRNALWWIFLNFGLLIFSAYNLAHFRGYSISSKRRTKEMEWERENRDKQPQ